MQYESTVWPDGFLDIGGFTFEQTWKQRKEWVKFTIGEMQEATGMFGNWREYCLTKSKYAEPHTEHSIVEIKNK